MLASVGVMIMVCILVYLCCVGCFRFGLCLVLLVGLMCWLSVWILDVLVAGSLLCGFKVLRVVGPWCFRPCCSGF